MEFTFFLSLAHWLGLFRSWEGQVPQAARTSPSSRTLSRPAGIHVGLPEVSKSISFIYWGDYSFLSGRSGAQRVEGGLIPETRGNLGKG